MEEQHFYISSLAADAKRLNEAARLHWRIENQLHWRLDNEDGACNRKQSRSQTSQLEAL